MACEQTDTGDESEQTDRGAGGEGVREYCRRSGVARILPTGQWRSGVRDEDEADATGDACCTVGVLSSVADAGEPSCQLPSASTTPSLHCTWRGWPSDMCSFQRVGSVRTTVLCSGRVKSGHMRLFRPLAAQGRVLSGDYQN